MLEQMERALYEEDPRFAAAIRDTPAPASRARRGAGLGVLVAALGVVAMVGGLVSNVPLISILGFIAVVGGTYIAVRGVATEGRAAKGPQPPKSAGFLKSAEDRFRNRRDGNPI
jgi:hypothetical protein